MSTKINDDSMSLEIHGRVIATAEFREHAADWPAWDHRKIAAMMRTDGHQASTSTRDAASR